jgi:hypothetical protein
VLARNWRVLPAQFGMPAQSHVLAELIRVAGFEAIQYHSTKGPGLGLVERGPGLHDIATSSREPDLLNRPLRTRTVGGVGLEG